MSNQNGRLIMQALQDLDDPATMTEIVTHIADTVGVPKRKVKASVVATLEGGVRYGYIQRARRRYFAAPADMEMEMTDDDETAEPEPGPGPEPEPAPEPAPPAPDQPQPETAKDEVLSDSEMEEIIGAHNNASRQRVSRRRRRRQR